MRHGGDGFIVMGFLFGVPGFILLGVYLNIMAAAKAAAAAAAFAVVHVPATKLTAALAAGSAKAAVVTAGISAAAASGIAVVGLYGVAGLVNMGFAARESYKSNESVKSLFYSRFFNKDGWTIKGVLKSTNAILFVPFIYLGGYLGKGVQSVVEYSKSNRVAPANRVDESTHGEQESLAIASYSSLHKTLGFRHGSEEICPDVAAQSSANVGMTFFAKQEPVVGSDIGLSANTNSDEDNKRSSSLQ